MQYYPDEESGWQIKIEELERAYKEAYDNNIDVRAIVLINPGNATGPLFYHPHRINPRNGSPNCLPETLDLYL